MPAYEYERETLTADINSVDEVKKARETAGRLGLKVADWAIETKGVSNSPGPRR